MSTVRDTTTENKIDIVTTTGNDVTVTQPVTNVIQVATPGPAGPAGPIGPSGSFETGSFATTGSNNFIGNQVITGSLTVSGSSTFTNIGPSIFSGSITVANGNITSNGNATLLGSLTTNNVNVKTSTNTATLLSDNITGNYNYYFPPNSGGTLVLRSELPRAGNGLTDTIGFPSTISLGGSVTNNITLADTSNSYIFITEGLGHRIAVFDDNSAPVLDFQRATGTPGSPTAPLANNYLGVIGAGAATLSESGRSAAIIFQATSDFTSGSKGSSIGFYTTPSGSNLSSRVMTVSDDAQVGIGTRYPTNTLHVSGSGKFTDELIAENNIIVTGSIESPTSITFDTTTTDADAIARLKWNETEGTLDLGMGGGLATLQIGQELYYPKVVNKSGEDLINGTLVMVDPSQPAQGNRLRVIRAVTDGTYPSELIVGPLTEDVDNNQEGFATWFGYVRNLNRTDLENNGVKSPTDNWDEGDILYTNPNLDGGYTSSMQSAPAGKSSIAAVTAVNGQNITLLVRPKLDTNVGNLHDVTDLTTTSSYGDLFIKSGNIWTTGKSLSGSYSLTGNLTASGNISSSGIVYGTTGSFSHLQGNSPITVGDSVTFQQPITASGNISASGTITATSASFTHISGTISNIIWTVDFTDGELNTILYAPYNLSIDSIDNVYNSPTSSISSSGSPYTLGNAITTGEPIDITVSTGSVINLNITR